MIYQCQTNTQFLHITIAYFTLLLYNLDNECDIEITANRKAPDITVPLCDLEEIL